MSSQANRYPFSAGGKRWWLKGFFILLGLLGSPPGMAQVGFEVAPARLFFHQRNGLSQSALVRVHNPTGTRLVLQVSCSDWRRDSNGVKIYSAPGSLTSSCCSSLRISPAVIELAPGEKKDVAITLIAAPKLSMDHISNAMLLFTQNKEQEDLTRPQVAAPQLIIRVQIGIHVYFLPKPDLPAAIDIIGMDVIKPDDQQQVRINVHNTGQTLLESQLRLEYLNLQTMEEVKMEAIPVNTMPYDQFWVAAVPPSSLPSGKYLIVAVLDSGPGIPLKVAELETVLQ